MRFTIQKKILISIILIIATVGGIVAVFVSLRVEKVLLNERKTSFSNTNIEDAKQLNLILNNTRLFAKSTATRMQLIELLEQPNPALYKEVTELFDGYQKDFPNFLSIYIMDSTGSALISTDRSFIGNNYGFRPYFKEAIRQNSYIDVALGKTTKELVVYFSHVVQNRSGKAVGVVAVKIKPSSLYDDLIDTELDKNSSLMLTDQYGVILFSTKKDRIMKSLGILTASTQDKLISKNVYLGKRIQPLRYNSVQKTINSYSKPATLDFVDEYNGEKERKLISVSHVKDSPFYFISEVSIDPTIAQINEIASVIGIGIFASAILCLLVLSFVIRKLLAPLHILKQNVETLSKGDFSQIIKINSHDEVEDLANVFNTMQSNLQELYGGLEQKVAEKTKELTHQLESAAQSKRAIANLLEDVNEQKDKIEQHTVELQKFQLAVDNAHDHIVITDPDGAILYANKGVEKITGFSRDEIYAKKAGDKKLWGGFMGQQFYVNFWKKIKTEKKVFIGEFNNRRKNGQSYIAESQVSPILDENGNVLYFVGIERDITKAKEIDRMKTEFISLASHQLRTPLSAMKWFLEMLLHGDAGKLTDEQSDFISNIEQSNNRMIELVNSLLNVSRIESGRIIIEPTETDLKIIIEEVQKEILVKLQEKKQVITLVFEENLPHIPLDQKLIRQVYINLLTNAIKYSPEQTEIKVSVKKEGDMVITQVIDAGFGIPVAEQDHIFNKFFRATNAIRKETEGNGLGLYLVKSIVESSGGKVWFTSEAGKGTSFFFSIPLEGMKKKEGEVRMS